MAKRKREQQYPWEQIEGATGASDASSGGGAGAGTPDPETVEGSGGRVLRGNVERDKKRLFPERFGKATRSKSTTRKPATGRNNTKISRTTARSATKSKSRARKAARK